MKQKLILIRGIPGSGKTTMAKHLKELDPSLDYIEADQYFENEKGEYIYDKSQIHKAHKWCQTVATDWLYTGHSVIVSNTFIRKWEMKPYMDVASKLGIPVTIIIMRTKHKSIRNVPQEVIDRMESQFEE